MTLAVQTFTFSLLKSHNSYVNFGTVMTAVYLASLPMGRKILRYFDLIFITRENKRSTLLTMSKSLSIVCDPYVLWHVYCAGNGDVRQLGQCLDNGRGYLQSGCGTETIIRSFAKFSFKLTIALLETLFDFNQRDFFDKIHCRSGLASCRKGRKFSWAAGSANMVI